MQHTDTETPGISDVHVSGRIHSDTERIKELRIKRRAIISAESQCPDTRDGRDHSVRDLAHDIVLRVGDINVARAIHRDALRKLQLRERGRSIIAGVFQEAVSRNVCW
jgi:hypothetical protein